LSQHCSAMSQLQLAQAWGLLHSPCLTSPPWRGSSGSRVCRFGAALVPQQRVAIVLTNSLTLATRTRTPVSWSARHVAFTGKF